MDERLSAVKLGEACGRRDKVAKRKVHNLTGPRFKSSLEPFTTQRVHRCFFAKTTGRS